MSCIIITWVLAGWKKLQCMQAFFRRCCLLPNVTHMVDSNEKVFHNINWREFSTPIQRFYFHRKRVRIDEAILRISEMVQNPSKFTAFGKNSLHALSSTSSCNGKNLQVRQFLLQFIHQCKEKPAKPSLLDAIGLEPMDHASLAMNRSGSGRRSGTAPTSRRASSQISLGFLLATFGKGTTSPFAGVGNFNASSASKLSSEYRFAMSALNESCCLYQWHS